MTRTALCVVAAFAVMLTACDGVDTASATTIATAPAPSQRPGDATTASAPTTLAPDASVPSGSTLPRQAGATFAPGREGSPDPFIPVTTTADGNHSASVVLPDGRAVEISWPTDLDIMSYGMRPHTWIATDGGYSTDVWFRHGEPVDVIGQFSNPRVVGEHLGADGSEVLLWRVGGSGGLDFLSFDVGTWTVLVPNPRPRLNQVRLDESDLTVWASLLTGREDPSGMPVLEAHAPLFLAPPADPQGNSLLLFSPHGVIELFATQCDPSTSEASSHFWCTPSGDLVVQVDGDELYQERVRAELHVRLGTSS